MIIIRTLDGRSVDIKQIDVVYIIPAPIFVGRGDRPIMWGVMPVTQPDGSEKKYEDQNIDWRFEDEKDFKKHLKKDKKNRNLHYVIACNIRELVGDENRPHLYILKRGSEKSCIKKRKRVIKTLPKLDLWLTNWQVVIAAIIGALVATVGYIAVELMKWILNSQGSANLPQ